MKIPPISFPRTAVAVLFAAALLCRPAHAQVTVGLQISAPAAGAVENLEGQTSPAMSLSSALLALDEPGPPLPSDFTIPTAFVSGLATADNYSGLNCDSCAAATIRAACSGDPLAGALTPDGWPAMFGESSDAVVPFTSQVDGYNDDLSLVSVNYGLIHSAGLANLDFNLPDELGHGDVTHPASQAAAEAAQQLLNTPVTDPHFFKVP